VVTVLALKPACESSISFCGEAAAVVVAVLAHPVTKVKAATALRTLVRTNSFFICFVLLVLLVLERIMVVLSWFLHPDNSKLSAARL
jgi:hypothetical protein